MSSPTFASKRILPSVLFALAAGYLLLSPALPQLGGWGSPWIRQWTMFSGVGVGLPKGTFILEEADGTAIELPPLAVAGLSRYPVRQPIYYYDGYVGSADDLALYADVTCRHLREGSRLRFSGTIAQKYDWLAVENALVCEASQ